MSDLDKLLRDFVEYRDHCYCSQQYEVVDLLDKVINRIEELEKCIERLADSTPFLPGEGDAEDLNQRIEYAHQALRHMI